MNIISPSSPLSLYFPRVWSEKKEKVFAYGGKTVRAGAPVSGAERVRDYAVHLHLSKAKNRLQYNLL